MSGYHRGEMAVQRRAGLAERAAHTARAVRTEIPAVAADFLAAQPLLVVGAADARGDLWCSLLTGTPGFLRARDARTLDVTALPRGGDPLAEVLAEVSDREPVPVGALAIEPVRRRRMRVNGTARQAPDRQGWRLRTEQVYANCPKYIQKRTLAPASPTTAAAAVPRTGTHLTGADRELLERSDTFFVTTADDTGAVDTNHRGGGPGFVSVHSPALLSWPDYAGNAMFGTLGNLHVNPRAGLLVPDWESGGLLQLTGTARVLWGADAGPEGRSVEFSVEKVRAAPSGGLLAEGPPEYSRANPALTTASMLRSVAPGDPRSARPG
ncbi:pyridoxamine 5'-phosphate oxidase family protein [Nocardiopsis exhalans]|uniref:Pyridoxamine 5'-phosphate oxidase family protein n=1 Tax=Nocardiopsis exhalans TaxID=163604 RepID=A0ABY5DDE3_9ACTN|nr:pyridoxamine 5'-phosphate oxidase family protein [Nocardiopsis exhalans]USY22354.1 pyridoxamine 5'-phosphate oxidase family protein [Nocardiopsis exhalans]